MLFTHFHATSEQAETQNKESQPATGRLNCHDVLVAQISVCDSSIPQTEGCATY